MKKNVCTWLPATLEYWNEKGQQRLRVSFYQTNPLTGVRKRFRPTFDLNRKRVVQSGQQEELAQHLIEKINKVLPLGYPFRVDIDGKPLKGSKLQKEQNAIRSSCTCRSGHFLVGLSKENIAL